MTEPVWGVAPAPRPGRLPARCDVLVVGGGITGVLLLRALRGRCKAVLVERDRLAAGASGRNAGFLLAGVADCYAAAVRRYGRERARALWSLTAESHALLAESLGDGPAGYHRGGSVIEAASAEEARDLDESAQLLVEDGFEASFEDGRLINPRDGEVDPLGAVLALAAGAEDGSVQEGVEVARLEAARDGVRAWSTAGDECVAGIAVLATNGYLRQLVPELPVSPVRAQMAATAPAPALIADRPTYSNRGFRYWRQLQDGRVLAGGYRDTALAEEVGYVAEPTPRIQALLTAHLERLGALPVTHRWAGIMGFTPDGLPRAGPLPGPEVVYACGGYNGHGWGFAPVLARRVAEAITGSRPTSGPLL